MINITGNTPPWSNKEVANNTLESKISFHWNFKAKDKVIFLEDFGVTIKRAFFPKIPFTADTKDVVNIEPYNATTEKV